MPAFSARSLARLATCRPELQRLFKAVVADTDCTIICGHRAKAEQDKARAEGKSKLRWPRSKHNRYPSAAVDAAPWPLPAWDDSEAFIDFAQVVIKKAEELGIKIRYGGDWNGNGRSDDERFLDLVHFELAG